MAVEIPQNKAEFSASEIARITSGTLSGNDVRVTGVATDTRVDLRGKLFVALTGERFDAHEFVADAVSKGAACVLVERHVEVTGAPVVRVASTLRALGDLARVHRRRWNNRLIAVAGSAGKTTTRSAISAALESVAPGRVHSTRGNLNNLIGVPMILLGLERQHTFGVVEIGTNAPGEVGRLTELCDPDIGVLTVIGLEHTEGLGSIDEIEREEAEIFARLHPDSIAVGNADDERVLRRLSKSSVSEKVSYGRKAGSDYLLKGRKTMGVRQSILTIERKNDRVPQAFDIATCLVGDAGAYAVLAAIAAAESACGRNLAREEFARAFVSGLGEPGRLEPNELANGTLVLDDSYNSNPESLKSSIAAAQELAKFKKSRLVLVIGEMLELGESSKALHAEAATALVQSGAKEVIAVAGDAELFVEPAKSAGISVMFAKDSEQAAKAVRHKVQPGDVVLVKASRGVKAERVVEALIAHAGKSE
jgi:UDP-N-acetylmuramoyl-tripeptide--D-alanyl-D-alanine ligase